MTKIAYAQYVPWREGVVYAHVMVDEVDLTLPTLPPALILGGGYQRSTTKMWVILVSDLCEKHGFVDDLVLVEMTNLERAFFSRVGREREIVIDHGEKMDTSRAPKGFLSHEMAADTFWTGWTTAVNRVRLAHKITVKEPNVYDLLG